MGWNKAEWSRAEWSGADRAERSGVEQNNAVEQSRTEQNRELERSIGTVENIGAEQIWAYKSMEQNRTEQVEHGREII